MSDAIAFAILAAVAISLLLVGACTIELAACKSKASGLRLESSFGPLQGCLVTRMDGVVVPIENYGRADRE